ncbi:MAG: LuxR C-terminal-related transcriptional regulator, partial [Anaerolineae bacterium]|nr:LuxR C-terminal-related transcriptional regulator [Anaerolineae bacterium]
ARPVLNWLESLPTDVLDARPSLWVTYASALTVTGQQINSAEDKLQAAESALQDAESDEQTRNLHGHIAAVRAMLAGPQYQIETMMAQSQRALELLSADNLPVRTMATWAMGLAYQYQGERAAARQAYTEAVSISQASGNIMVTIAALTCLGQMQEAENQLYLAQQSYQRVLEWVGDPPWPTACEAYLGLARLHYQWDVLDRAEEYAQRGLELGKQIENVDTPVACGALLAQIQLARGDLNGATSILVETEQFAQQHNFLNQMPLIIAEKVRILLRQGNVPAAAHLAKTYDLPISQARIYLAQEDYPAALTVLAAVRHHAEAKDWQDEQLQVIVLQAVAYAANDEMDNARQRLDEALELAAPGGFIRIFKDEGELMLKLLSEVSAHSVTPDYTRKLLAAFHAAAAPSQSPSSQPLVEPLSERELEILQLVAEGFSNREISEQLFLALSTVKGHNRNIYDKLQVKRRTEAIARARELGLL